MSEWRWNAKSEAAALALAEGKTWKVVEREVGISTTTLARWNKEPAFQERIEQNIEAVVGEARRILRRNATHAAQVMANAAQYGSPLHSVRVAAAKDILDRVGLKPVEKQQVEQSGDMTITVRYVKPDATN